MYSSPSFLQSRSFPIHALRGAGLLTLFLASAALPRLANAQAPLTATEMLPPEVVKDSVSYGRVDEATVRVFSVGTVGVRSFDVWDYNFQVATPSAGHGTGFWVGSNGLILTANHVVEDAAHVVVRKPGDGGFLPAKVLHRSVDDDIAVLVVDEQRQGLQVSKDSQVRVRQTVFAIGYPVDATRTQAQSSKGIVSGQVESTLQLDISVNPGNSGGPVVNEGDQVVGMVIARGNVDGGVQGIGYAIGVARINAALAAAQQALAAGHKPFSQDDFSAARVVDELLNDGGFRKVEEEEDLRSRHFSRADFDRSLQQVADRVADPDLLVTLSGNLWNAGLVIRYGGVRDIGDIRLSESEAWELSDRLRISAIALVDRAEKADPTIGQRSAFVHAARDYQWPSIDGLEPSKPVKMNVGIRGGFNLRVNGETGSVGSGVSAEFQLQIGFDKRLHEAQFFLSSGLGFAQATIDLSEMDEASHRMLSADNLLGFSSPIGERFRFELAAGISLAHYTMTSANSDGFGEASAAELVLGLRATAGIAFKSFYLGGGVRRLGNTYWWEPLSLGASF